MGLCSAEKKLQCRLRLLRNRPTIGSAAAELLLLNPSPRLPHGPFVRVLRFGAPQRVRVVRAYVLPHPEKSPMGTAQQNVEYLGNQIFPNKTQLDRPRY